jgi:hypothetical protein
LGFELFVDDFIDFNLLLFGTFEDIFGLETGESVAGFLDDLVEHFLLLLLDFEGLNFFFLFGTFHFFLDGAFLAFLHFSLLVDDFQGAPSIKKFFHFCLKIQVLVTLDGFVVLYSICVQLDQVADDLL